MVGAEIGENEEKVIFWEKNGLNHGEFLLPKLNENNEKIEVKMIKSSKDSEILSIFLRFFILFIEKFNIFCVLEEKINNIACFIFVRITDGF